MLTYPHFAEWVRILWGRDAGLGFAGLAACAGLYWALYGRWLGPVAFARVRLGLVLFFFLSFAFMVLVGKG